MVPCLTQPPVEFVEKNKRGTQSVVVLDAPYKIRLAPARIPKPGPNEVRVRVQYVSICKSDLDIYRGKCAPEIVASPTRLGHDVVGVVDMVGASVQGVQSGDHAILRYLWGTFAEYIICDPSAVQVVPKNVPFIDALFIEIIPNLLYAAELGKITSESKVLILGQSVPGLVLTQAISRLKPRALAVTDLLDRKLNLARDFGATHLIKLPSPSTPPMTVAGKEFPDGFDVVISTLGTLEDPSNAIDACAKNGRIIVYNCIGNCKNSVDLSKAREKHIDFLYTNPPDNLDFTRFWEEGARLVIGKGIHTLELVTHVIELQDIAHAFRLRDRLDNDVIHVVIACNRDDMFPDCQNQ